MSPSSKSKKVGATDTWSVVVRDQDRVLAGLERGECDGILPDEWLEPDNLVQTALEEGFLDWFADFPDRRRRRSIDQQLFCRVMLCGRLVDTPSVAATGRVVFHSATLLDKLGFNFRQVRQGGPRTGDHRPFDEEALADYFSRLTARDYLAHQIKVAGQLRLRPELQGDIWLLDCQDTSIPNGHHQAGYHRKTAVLSVCTAAGPQPLLWNFGPAPQTADLTLGRRLLAAARRAWGDKPVRWLIMDAGFLDGPWLRALKRRGTDTVIRIREGMDNYEAAVRQAQAPGGAWQAVALPKRRAPQARPVRREILGLTRQPGWQGLDLPISVCVVRDTYPDKLEYWVLVCTQPDLSARAIYQLFRQRWGIEETFMALARYHGLNDLHACRKGLALALIHFTLLAQTLRYLCLQARAARGPRPLTKLLVVYWAGYYALLYASEVFEKAFAHMAVWEERQAPILEALRYCEGR